MKLLIVTQKVDKDDGYFGFFHDWLRLFASECESLVVIGLEVGTYDLPKNVTVLSLGKEEGRSLAKYIYRFLLYVWKYRNDYTHVFCHMNPPYIILGGWLWKLFRKPVGFWYIHRHVDLKLRIAEKFADIIFTATPESFALPSPKRNFMGQAVDLQKFINPTPSVLPQKPFTVISVGRITPIKNLDTLLRATRILCDKGYDIKVTLVGAPVTSLDEEYAGMLQKLVVELALEDRVDFVGNIPNNAIAKEYWKHHLSVNLCPTGGMDKAVLESLAAGVPAIVSNEAFSDYFGAHADELIFIARDEVSCAEKIAHYIENPQKEALKEFLFTRVNERSSLTQLIKRIVSILGAQ